MKTTSLFVAALFLASVAPGRAQNGPAEFEGPSKFIDLETDRVQDKQVLGIRTEVRGFGGHEDNTYIGVGLRLGMGNGLEGIFRGIFADRRDTATGSSGTIRHGGNDFEAILKYRPKGMGLRNVAGMIGVSVPDTPAQTEAMLTVGASMTYSIGERVELVINPKAICVRDNTIVGIGIGGSARISEGFHVAAEYTPVVSGDNTRSVATGGKIRKDTYGVAIHFTTRGSSTDWSLGYANALGNTTGYSLTPALGGSGGFYFSVSMRK